ncbi:unnamed protein product [Closterium sp. Naga37s-1]|nr:unnamed protein product [Closterium sp. Naga37s-1]
MRSHFITKVTRDKLSGLVEPCQASACAAFKEWARRAAAREAEANRLFSLEPGPPSAQVPGGGADQGADEQRHPHPVSLPPPPTALHTFFLPSLPLQDFPRRKYLVVAFTMEQMSNATHTHTHTHYLVVALTMEQMSNATHNHTLPPDSTPSISPLCPHRTSLGARLPSAQVPGGGADHGADEQRHPHPVSLPPPPTALHTFFLPSLPLQDFPRRKYLVVALTMEQMSNARTHLAEAARVAEESGRILVLPKVGGLQPSISGPPNAVRSYWDLSRFFNHLDPSSHVTPVIPFPPSSSPFQADCSRLSVASEHAICSYWDLSRFLKCVTHHALPPSPSFSPFPPFQADCSRLSVARQHAVCSYWDLSRFSRVEWVSPEFFLLTARAAFLNPSVGFVCVKTDFLHRPCFKFRELVEILRQILTFAMGHVPVPSNTIDVKMPQSKDVFNMLLHAWSDRDVVVWMKTTYQRIQYVPRTDVIANRVHSRVPACTSLYRACRSDRDVVVWMKTTYQRIQYVPRTDVIVPAVLPYRATWHDTAAQIIARLPKPVIGVHFRSEFIAWNVAQGMNANLTWKEVQHNLRQQMAACVQGAARKINQVRKKLQTQQKQQQWQEQVQEPKQGKQGQKQEQQEQQEREEPLINGLGQVVEGPTVFIAADIPFNASAAVQPRSESWRSMEVWLGRENTGRASRGALKWLRQHVEGTVMIDEVVPAVNGYDPVDGAGEHGKDVQGSAEMAPAARGGHDTVMIDEVVPAVNGYDPVDVAGEHGKDVQGSAEMAPAARGGHDTVMIDEVVPAVNGYDPGIVSILDKLVIAKADIFVAAERYCGLTAPELPHSDPFPPCRSPLSFLPALPLCLSPTGIVSILDKLVIARADIFVAAKQSCGGRRGFESDILQHRDEYGQAADSVVRWGYE